MFGGHFGPVLGSSGAILGLFWGFGGHFGPVFGGPEAIWGLFRVFRGHIGPPNLGAPEAILGLFWEVLGPLWNISKQLYDGGSQAGFRPFLAILGHFLHLGHFWALELDLCLCWPIFGCSKSWILANLAHFGQFLEVLSLDPQNRPKSRLGPTPPTL